jgi:aspartyl-tRNA(Asn)/glutamyl-tRNA(Gln) amidotransferase subunit A
MDADKITGMTLCDVAEAIHSRRLSSTEVVEACLNRIEAFDSKINSFISVEREDVLRSAKAADDDLARGIVRGPLHGVPLAHKDLFFRKGHVSTCGSKIMRDYVQTVTSSVLARLEAAGALYLGGLHMAEFAAGATGHNEHYGNCHNPWNTAHITGGSSSGSGAAVASRFVFGAMGSDTGGSVRDPASACGVVGLRPTYGRISRFGTLPRSWSHDTMGPLTRTVRDCALMTSRIAGKDPNDPTCLDIPVPDYTAAMDAGIKGLKIGVPVNYFYDDVSEDIAAALAESLTVIERQGAQIVEVKSPDLDPHSRLMETISKCECVTAHADWMRKRPHDYGEQVYNRIDAGLHIPATRYLEALSLRGRYLAEFMDAVFEKVDVLHTPVIPKPVPTIEETAYQDNETFQQISALMTKLTRPISYLGLPAMSVPCGFSKNGLPIGFQLVGRPFGEADLFAVADAYQNATEWHTASPEL